MISWNHITSLRGSSLWTLACMQGSDPHLLTAADSPLQIFGTAFVGEMSAMQLEMVAGGVLQRNNCGRAVPQR